MLGDGAALAIGLFAAGFEPGVVCVAIGGAAGAATAGSSGTDFSVRIPKLNARTKIATASSVLAKIQSRGLVRGAGVCCKGVKRAS